MKRVLKGMLFFCSFAALADDTVLKLYRPYGEATEQSHPVIKKKLIGHCDAQSQLILREDAWRCQAEGSVYDPCFAKIGASSKEVICPQSPWIGDSTAITVTKPLNNAQHSTLDMSTAYPWAIELSNGARCQAVETTDFFDNMPIRYQCANEAVLIGFLQRCKTVWSMLKKNNTGVETVDFKKVWF